MPKAVYINNPAETQPDKPPLRFPHLPAHRQGRKPEPPAQRFARRVNKTDGPIVNETLGRCWVLNAAKGKGISKARSSRWAWEGQYGPPPAGLQVLHKCDVDYCVRGDHLFLGTISDNMLDAFQKGRKSMAGNQNALGHTQSDAAKRTKSVKSQMMWDKRRAEKKDGFKLSAEAVAEIRARYVRVGMKSNSKELAAEYGVTFGHITRIVGGRQRRV